MLEKTNQPENQYNTNWQQKSIWQEEKEICLKEVKTVLSLFFLFTRIVIE